MANNNSSRLENLIEDIYEFVDSCKTTALRSDKIVVPKEELLDLLDELRLRTPDEIKKYQKIVASRDAILNEAEKKAAMIISNAQEKAARMVSEHEITQQAYNQANELIKDANAEAVRINEQVKKSADEITNGAFSYTTDLLDMAEQVLSKSYKEAKEQFDGMLTTLSNSLNVVRENKKEMSMSGVPEVDMLDELGGTSTTDADSDNDSTEEDFDFDADTFIDNID